MFPNSFATGELFQHNPDTGDKRNSGTLASLAGLETALATGDARAVDLAVDRILMGHALIASFGGIPLIYMGDEIALLNDHGYHDDPAIAHDSRWLHRPRMDWETVARLGEGGTPRLDAAARVHDGLRRIIARRAATPEFHAGNPTIILRTGNPALFAHARRAPTGSVVCLSNFQPVWTAIPTSWAIQQGATLLHDTLSDAPVGGPRTAPSPCRPTPGCGSR